MNSLPDPKQSKSLQFHQVGNIILTVILGGALSSSAQFIFTTNNSIILLSEKTQVMVKLIDNLSERMDKLEDRLRVKEMER